MKIRMEEIFNCFYDASAAFENCVGFIDSTVVSIARPSTDAMKRDCSNGYKINHALNYQYITTPDGMILNMNAPVVGRGHDWFLYIQSGLDGIFSDALFLDGSKYFIYGDPG